MRKRLFRYALFAALALFAAPAGAQQKPASSDEAQPAPDTGGLPGAPTPSIATSFPVIADPFGIRAALAPRGIQYGINYLGDVQGNPVGGVKRGLVYEGRLELVVDVDLSRLVGWQDAALHFNGYQIHGTGLSRYFIGNFSPTSNVEALASTRLYEAWFEQKLLDGKLAVRAGQLGADTEFITSSAAGLFLNGSLGWPQWPTSDLPSSAASYPLATPGIRLKTTPDEHWTLLLGLFNGDAAGPGLLDPQKRNRHGVNFRVTDAPFLIGEAQYAYNQGKDAMGLAGTAKLGVFNYFGAFDDLRYTASGLSIGNPTGMGAAARRRGDLGVYGVLDQQVYRLPGDDPTKGVSIFVRAVSGPSDRNLIDYYIDGGVNVTGLVPDRPDDAFGAAGIFSHISSSVSGLDADRVLFSHATPFAKRDYEAILEVTYQAQVVPGLSVQPVFQYIKHPGGHAPDPLSPGGLAPIRDAQVFGVRLSVKY